ncbi:type I pullulanase [Streptococcus cameli]
MALRSFQAYLESPTSIRLEMDKKYDVSTLHFTVETKDTKHDLLIDRCIESTQQVTYFLTNTTELTLEEQYTVFDQDRNGAELGYGAIVRSQLFDQYFFYDGSDLGVHYTTKSTSFKLWAPISKTVFLVINQTPYPMGKEQKGVWSLEIEGDWEGAHYHYLHRVNGHWLEVHDPYALSSCANSGDSIVIDPKKLRSNHRSYQNPPLAQAVLYEMSVRDFSQQKEAGFQAPGQFKGLTESPSIGTEQIGMDYIKNLGVTHIQLMPVYDFGSVDETYPQLVYNWGYDPVQYNVPEGSFSSNPEDPYARIVELQTAIEAYHQAGIGVIMDVVYNHVYNANTYAFEKLIPGYFYRFDEENGQRHDGTFCGNDVASERSMIRHYIKHSLKQWVQLYGFDGFRFDLMGILDLQTMQEISKELQDLYPTIYLYGEGWKMQTGLPQESLAHQYNAHELPQIAFFNDEYRDTLKRILAFPETLLQDGYQKKMEDLLVGSYNRHFLQPIQSINYIECHDNATFYDYLQIKQPNWTHHNLKRAASFGLQLLLLSQGIPFIHSGQEFFRTKDNLDNTYNSPDSINQLDWLRANHYKEHVAHIKEWVAFRKEHPALSLSQYSDIEYSCDFYWLTDFVLRYQVETTEETMQFILNFSTHDFHFTTEDGQEVIFTYPPLVDKSKQNLTLAGQNVCALVEKKL